MIALLGNLSRDVFPDRPSCTGGAPFHAARALRHVNVATRIYARCSAADRDELLPAVLVLGTPVHYVEGRATASFAIEDAGDERTMHVRAVGDSWSPSDLPQLPDEVRWVHVAPLLRPDFPPETLAALGRDRHISLDGQGLVRPSTLGALVLDGNFDPALLRHVQVLKLSDEEAAAVGAPDTIPVPEVIVTHGSRGSTLYTKGRVEDIPAVPLEGGTGTGDAFAVAYVAARSEGEAPDAAARRATAVVASLLTSR